VPPGHRSGARRAFARRVGRALKAAASLALDQLLPPRCLGCGEAVDAAGRVCVACFQALVFLTPPLCAGCGAPLPAAAVAYCGACLAAPPPYDRARAALGYNAASRRMLLAFKHGDRTEAARTFAAWMRNAAPELVAEARWVVPVPLHRWRLFARRYNQAALLAYALVERTLVLPDALVRVRPTPSQGLLSRAGRARNVAGAFRVRRAAGPLLDGAPVLLVDDVMTTGATLEACARALRRAGATRVDALTVARVVRDGGEVI
jgi:ComF family protein